MAPSHDADRPRIIVVVSGPGGAGKGTIVRTLVDRDPSLRLSISWTTRKRRVDDTEDSYVFVDRPSFQRHRDNGGFLEWNEFLGCLYGTPLPDPDDSRDLILEIDVAGCRQILTHYPAALCVFVDASDLTLRRRLLARGDTWDRAEERLVESDRERTEAAEIGYHFVANEDLERAIEAVLALIAKQRR